MHQAQNKPIKCRRGGGGVERGGDPGGRPRCCSRARPPGSPQRRATIPGGRPRGLGLLHAGAPPPPPQRGRPPGSPPPSTPLPPLRIPPPLFCFHFLRLMRI